MIVDLVEKGRRVRTVAVPFWVKQSIDRWTAAADIQMGLVGRSRSPASRAKWHSGIGQSGRSSNGAPRK
ncbi:phage integrase family protein [Acidisarcina polymorpha]|uniref:Phage integrase family protein n=1 Tax=Acidisarcina polymorpha TaxID=2211140 RepID=A0A2Z5FYP4_9BACT|nr:phage integrase family protein [Acidisarcina polymorpha]